MVRRKHGQLPTSGTVLGGDHPPDQSGKEECKRFESLMKLAGTDMSVTP